MTEFTQNAYAKINLSLDVLSKRADGYHNVSMVMHQVSLADTVTLSPLEQEGIQLTSDSAQIPHDEKNIAFRAAQLMLNRFGIHHGIHIHIHKEIPVAGGMAGGSTDAAAVICLLNQAFQLDLSKETLMSLALELGADVPYCIFARPALAEGIGENLTEICGLPPCKIVIVNPNIEISTKEIYEEIDQVHYAEKPNNHRLIELLKEQNLKEACVYMKNVMQPISIKKCPKIAEILQSLQSLGAIRAMMTGSGATCFGIFSCKSKLENVSALFPDCFVKITSPYWGGAD